MSDQIPNFENDNEVCVTDIIINDDESVLKINYLSDTVNSYFIDLNSLYDPKNMNKVIEQKVIDIAFDNIERVADWVTDNKEEKDKQFGKNVYHKFNNETRDMNGKIIIDKDPFTDSYNVHSYDGLDYSDVSESDWDKMNEYIYDQSYDSDESTEDEDENLTQKVENSQSQLEQNNFESSESESENEDEDIWA